MGLCISNINNNHASAGDDYDHHFEYASGNVHLVTTKQSWDQKMAEANTNAKIVVANFSALWCAPCKMMAQFYSELSEKYPCMMFLVIDVDQLTELSTSWDIKATPTIFFLKNGLQIDKIIGANKPELHKKIIALSDN